ncbi:MAG: hypothetical protein HY540_05545 [Deltaproteobacteria bacterium]|nr:hypothetical protein [Deltaproteobacteria bacterium]
MKETLFHIASDYVSVIEKIEKTSDPKQLQFLEEQRTILHGKFLDALKKQGIEFKDRDHATRIAFRISKGEL